MKHLIESVSLAALLALGAAGCASSAPQTPAADSSKTETDKNNESSNESTGKESSGKEDNSAGESASNNSDSGAPAQASKQADGAVLEIISTEIANQSADGLPAPDGEIFVRYVVRVRNDSDKEIGASSTFNFTGYADGEELTDALIDAVDGYELLETTSLQPGESVTGYISYYAPENASSFRLEYDSDLYSTDNETITFELSK